MSTVRMEHPKLPGQPIEVAASAVPHHRAAGWAPVEDPPPAPEPAEAPEKPSGASASQQSKTPKRRRTNEGTE